MASGSQIQAKIAKVLTRLNATGRVVSWRTVTVTGSHPVLGGGTRTNTDEVCDPQPAVDILPTDAIATSSGLLQLGDFKLTFSGDVPEAYFATKMLMYGDQVLHIVKRDPVAIYGTIVAWEVIARAKA
jgi:hypothetical protein